MTSRFVGHLVPQISWIANHGSVNSANALRCSSSMFISLTPSDVMKLCMSWHDSIALMVIHMPTISSSLFVLCLSQDSQSAMNSCGPGLYSILMLY